MRTITNRSADVVVVGGGLAGLAAAALLARKGLRVALFERSREPGGRARSTSTDGFSFNQGPHALYCAGPGMAVLTELSVRCPGGSPSASGAYAIAAKRLHTLPGGVFSLLTTSLLRAAEKMEAGRVLARLARLDTAGWRSNSFHEWLREEVSRETVRGLLRALVRVATFTNDTALLSAGAALDQLRLALQGVIYIDGGWQTLVNDLKNEAQRSGVDAHPGQPVTAIRADARVRGVILRDGSVFRAPFVVLATGPVDAAALVREACAAQTVAGWARTAIPVRVASLDVALWKLPRPHALIALDIDEPVYASVHSAVARMAPDGAALIHVTHYGGVTDENHAAVRQQLFDVLELLQPGWCRLVVRQRFLPRLIASHAMVTAAQGGTSGRPGPEVPSLPGLYVAGDWVGPEGMLADAALASARRAAHAVLAHESEAKMATCLAN